MEQKSSIWRDAVYMDKGYSRVPNKHRPTFINFGSFFQGLRSYLRQLHYYLGVYVYCFSQFFPGSTLIWGPTLIRNSRVNCKNYFQNTYIWKRNAPRNCIQNIYSVLFSFLNTNSYKKASAYLINKF